MKAGPIFSCVTAVTGLTAGFFFVSLVGALSLGKIGFVWAIFLSPVLAVVAVSRWNGLARRLRLRLAGASVVALVIVFAALQVAGVTLFYVDTVGMWYVVLGLAAVFTATLIVAVKRRRVLV
jgi:hypothetical protein